MRCAHEGGVGVRGGHASRPGTSKLGEDHKQGEQVKSSWQMIYARVQSDIYEKEFRGHNITQSTGPEFCGRNDDGA